jgi:transcriptional regulator with XRE-family HTH domain
MCLSQKQVARILGLNDTSPISRWEKGLVFPNIAQLFRLTRIYKTTAEELYTDLWQKITREHILYEDNLMACNESS